MPKRSPFSIFTAIGSTLSIIFAAQPATAKNISQYFILPVEGIEAVTSGGAQPLLGLGGRQGVGNQQVTTYPRDDGSYFLADRETRTKPTTANDVNQYETDDRKTDGQVRIQSPAAAELVYRRGSTNDKNIKDPSQVNVEFRGIWIAHFKPSKAAVKLNVMPVANESHSETTYSLASTKHCSARIPKSKFTGSEFVLRNIGRKDDWMSQPRAILYSLPKYQGPSASLELFANGSWTQVDPALVGFYPRSSIVINSNWFVQGAQDSFCLIGQNTVSFISDWKAEKYGDPETDRTFPTVSPGCPQRPFQVAEFPEATWKGRDFCYASAE